MPFELIITAQIRSFLLPFTPGKVHLTSPVHSDTDDTCPPTCHRPTFCFTSGEDYCQRESFNASCPDGHVVIMTEALYGRMHVGRCVNDMHIGCRANVREFMDRLCSGRQSCSVPVRKLMDYAQPCDEDYTSFLSTRYKCIKGTIYITANKHNFCSKCNDYSNPQFFFFFSLYSKFVPILVSYGHVPEIC